MDHEDWRVTISFPDPAQAGRAKLLFPRHKVVEEARRRLGYRIAMGADGSEVFLYAGTEVGASEAERVAREVLAAHHFRAGFAIHRWHPLEERWEDRGVAMPRTEAERQAEHQRLLADETAESLDTGVAQWQARAEFPSHQEAVAMAARLRSEGWAVIRRWNFLVVGSNNEDEAQQLAAQIRREAPPDATVSAGHSPTYLPFAGF